MTFDPTRLGSRLRGKSLFLSASVPSPERKYLRVPNAAFEIDQAVISLTRAVLSEAGSLVFGGHPSISHMVATVAAEYSQPVRAESSDDRPAPSIRIYQSEAYRRFEPPVTPMMYRLGYATLRWIEARDGERYNPQIKNVPQCLQSLEDMRRAMIGETSPDAMVCIGGMQGVELEAQLFSELRPGAPIYALALTGGACHTLAQLRNDVTVMDVAIVRRLQARRRQRGAEQQDEPPVIPYPLIMQIIVDQVAERSPQSFRRKAN